MSDVLKQIESLEVTYQILRKTFRKYMIEADSSWRFLFSQPTKKTTLRLFRHQKTEASAEQKQEEVLAGRYLLSI